MWVRRGQVTSDKSDRLGVRSIVSRRRNEDWELQEDAGLKWTRLITLFVKHSYINVSTDCGCVA